MTNKEAIKMIPMDKLTAKQEDFLLEQARECDGCRKIKPEGWEDNTFCPECE